MAIATGKRMDDGQFVPDGGSVEIGSIAFRFSLGDYNTGAGFNVETPRNDPKISGPAPTLS
jgi:hypothetical protein